MACNFTDIKCFEEEDGTIVEIGVILGQNGGLFYMPQAGQTGPPVPFTNGTMADLFHCGGVNTFSEPYEAPADGEDSFGNNYSAGDTLIEFPGGAIICVPAKDGTGGGSNVTDNTDNTGTVTASDGTSGTFITELLANDGAVGTSRPVDPATDILLHDGSVTPDAAFPGDISTEAALVYKNPDGKLVVPAAPATVADVDSIIDNGDNTSTVMATDDQGNATTGTVLNDLLVNNGAYGVSRSVAPAADIFLTENNVADGTNTDPACTTPVEKLADGSLASAANQNYVPWVDSGDGCTPEPRTACLDTPALTCRPDGHIFTAGVGEANWTECHLKDSEWFRSDLIPAAYDDAAIGALDGAGNTQIYNFSIDIPNVDTCRPMTYLVVARLGNPQAIIRGGNRWVLTYTSTTPGWSGSTNVTFDARFLDPGTGTIMQFGSNVDVACGQLAPGATLTLDSVLELHVQNYNSNQFNRINFGNMDIHAIGVYQ